MIRTLIAMCLPSGESFGLLKMESVINTSTGIIPGLAAVAAGAAGAAGTAKTGKPANKPHKNKVERKVIK
jgi:hypothetical protein